MNRQAPPTLWLRCGRCADGPNLATVTAPAAPRITGHRVPVCTVPDRVFLPGMDLVIDRRRDGVWTARPGGTPDDWSHKISCKSCGAEHRISSERISAWWSEFIATRRPRDVRYLGRDR